MISGNRLRLQLWTLVWLHVKCEHPAFSLESHDKRGIVSCLDWAFTQVKHFLIWCNQLDLPMQIKAQKQPLSFWNAPQTTEQNKAVCCIWGKWSRSWYWQAEQQNQTTGESFYFVVWAAQEMNVDCLQMTNLAACFFMADELGCHQGTYT